MIAAALRVVSKRFGEAVALDRVDFAIEAGEVVALAGPNGAGKTTALAILLGLRRPDNGTAELFGVDPRQVRARLAVGVTPQESGFPPTLRVREIVELVRAHFPFAVPTDQLLGRFRLDTIARRQAGGLSGGERRRLAVALAFAGDPAAIFLDEPTAGLDVESRRSVWAEIDRYSADGGTVLLTTHYLEEADHLASRLAIVDRGRVVAEGTPDALKGELSGDAIHVDLAQVVEEGRVRAALSGVSSIRELSIEGASVRARADNGATVVPAMITALESGSARVASVRVTRPSLDDVYLRHTGRTFSEADSGGAR
jgi:ABC-2 type transport system ATP-binding protein